MQKAKRRSQKPRFLTKVPLETIAANVLPMVAKVAKVFGRSRLRSTGFINAGGETFY